MKESFLIDVLKKGVSPFHCVEAAMQTLEESGFEELEYARPWNLKKGKAYMMNHHGTTLYAFTVGENFRADAMLRMAAAHTDYPDQTKCGFCDRPVCAGERGSIWRTNFKYMV